MRRDGISKSVAYITFDIAFHDWSHRFLVEYVVCHSNSKGQIQFISMRTPRHSRVVYHTNQCRQVCASHNLILSLRSFAETHLNSVSVDSTVCSLSVT